MAWQQKLCNSGRELEAGCGVAGEKNCAIGERLVLVQ